MNNSFKQDKLFSRDSLSKRVYSFLLISSSFWLLLVLPVVAQEAGLDIAQTYTISGVQPEFGDIISYEREGGIYQLAASQGDEKMFGVTIFEPILVLETSEEGIPVVSGGEVRVNVTTLGGDIKVGDFLTSSELPGKGRKAEVTDTFVLGVALEPFDRTISTTTITLNNEQITTGSITVLLTIGTRKDALDILEERSGQTAGVSQATVLNIIQYAIAGFIALGSIYIAFRNFGPNIKNGVLSIGRNPLAKSSIQSMVILNIVLIFLVSAAGLFAGLAIILLPI